jgi:hypothetical protein
MLDIGIDGQEFKCSYKQKSDSAVCGVLLAAKPAVSVKNPDPHEKNSIPAALRSMPRGPDPGGSGES